MALVCPAYSEACWCEAVAFAVVGEDAQDLGLPVAATHDVQGHGGERGSLAPLDADDARDMALAIQQR